MWSSTRSKPARPRAIGAARRSRATTVSMSARSISFGAGQPRTERHGRGPERRPRLARAGAARRPPRAARTTPCGPRGPSWMPDLRPRVRVHEVDDAPPGGGRAPRRRSPRSPSVMRPSGETSVISAITSPAPPTRAAAEVDEVPVVRRRRRPPSTGTSGETTMRFCERAGRADVNGVKHRRGHGAVARPRRAPRVVGELVRAPARTSAGSRLREVVVRDALAARHQVERELRAGSCCMQRATFSNHAWLVCRRPLDLRARPTRRAASYAASTSGTSAVPCVSEGARERDRVLHRELRARADREVRRVDRVAQQHDVARGASARSGSSGTRRQIERFVSSRCPSRWSAKSVSHVARPSSASVGAVEARARPGRPRGTRRSRSRAPARTGRRGPRRGRARSRGRRT